LLHFETGIHMAPIDRISVAAQGGGVGKPLRRPAFALSAKSGFDASRPRSRRGSGAAAKLANGDEPARQEK
jgi:hypothetical protein